MVLVTQSSKSAAARQGGRRSLCRGPLSDTNVDTTRCQTYTWDDRANRKEALKRASNDALSLSLPDNGRGGSPADLASSAGESVVTKKEIVRTIADEIGLTQLKTKEIVQKTFDAIVETLVEDHRIELRNFGVFEVKKRAARKARNPRTGEKVEVAEKFVVTFKPGKEMEERVRELERRAAEEAAERRRAEEAAAAADVSPDQSAGSSVPPSANGQADNGQAGHPGDPDSGLPTPYSGYDRSNQ